MCLKNAEANGSSFRRKFNRLLYGFDRSRYTYNQGVVLGGLVWLHKLTGDDELLTRGAAIIDAVLTHLTDGDGVLEEAYRCGNQALFKGIFVRYLLQETSLMKKPP